MKKITNRHCAVHRLGVLLLTLVSFWACAPQTSPADAPDLHVVEPYKATIKVQTLDFAKIAEIFQKAIETEGFKISKVDTKTDVHLIAEQSDHDFYSKAQGYFSTGENYARGQITRMDLHVIPGKNGMYTMTMSLEKETAYVMGEAMTEAYRDDDLFRKICGDVDTLINHK